MISEFNDAVHVYKRKLSYEQDVEASSLMSFALLIGLTLIDRGAVEIPRYNAHFVDIQRAQSVIDSLLAQLITKGEETHDN